jgi:hypothetical protein
MSLRRGIAGRDQGVSAFSAILGRLCDAANAAAVALVDDEGETVDYAGSLEPYAAKIMAAELAIVRRVLQDSPSLLLSASHRVLIRASRCSYCVEPLDRSYTLVLQLPRRSFRVSERAIAEAVRELCQEAELTLPARFQDENWARVEVQESRGKVRRPHALWLNGKWAPLVVLGQYASPSRFRRELGFRAQLIGGEEITLVRESYGSWFIDAAAFLGTFR